VRTAEVKLPAPRPLRCGLKVERAAGLLENAPLPIDDALEQFFREWQRRGS
jgi:dTDP-4-dehydrorhamnose reductase